MDAFSRIVSAAAHVALLTIAWNDDHTELARRVYVRMMGESA
jgi:hypothetical protein